jgi:hypothetical protein
MRRSSASSRDLDFEVTGGAGTEQTKDAGLKAC